MILIVEVLLLFLCSFVSGKTNPLCSEKDFYKPYVEIRTKKSGPALDRIDKTGFLDISLHPQVTMCINGPAILLQDYEETESGGGVISTYSKPRFRTYVHECLAVNSVPSNILKELRSKKTRITSTIKVKGMRVAGVQLIGQSEDYRLPEPAMFSQEKYGHREHPQQIVSDGSFALIAKKGVQYCFTVNDEFRVLLQNLVQEDNQICIWSLRQKDSFFDRYEAIFRSNRSLSQYSPWTQECGQDGAGGGTGGAGGGTEGGGNDGGTLTTTTEPTTTTTTTTTPAPTPGPFSIIGPEVPHSGNGDGVGSEDGSGSGDGDDGTGDGDGDVDDKSTSVGDGTWDSKLPEIKLQYKIELDECYPLPDFASQPKDSCADPTGGGGGGTGGDGNGTGGGGNGTGAEGGSGNGTGSEGGTGTGGTGNGGDGTGTGSSDDLLGCSLLEYFFDTDKGKKQVKDNVPQWKLNILDILAEIFGKICEPFPRHMAYTIHSVLEYYLSVGHQTDEESAIKDDKAPKFRKQKLNIWNFIETDLKICNNLATEPIYMEWTYEGEVLMANDGSFDPSSMEKPEPTDHAKKGKSGIGINIYVDEEGDNDRSERSTEVDFYDDEEDKDINFIEDDDDDMNSSEDDGNDDKNSIEDVEDDMDSIEDVDDDMNAIDDDYDMDFYGKRYDSKNIVTIIWPYLSSHHKLKIKAAWELLDETSGGERHRVKKQQDEPKVKIIPFHMYNQEAYPSTPSVPYHFEYSPIDVKHISKQKSGTTSEISVLDVMERNDTGAGAGAGKKSLFYYEDTAEFEYELNIGIDMAWKIFATVAGYCNQYYGPRQSETFMRFYNMYYEDFLNVVQDKWKSSDGNEDLQILLSEWSSESGIRWLDSCLEASYLDSKTETFRPPRPLTIGAKKKTELVAFKDIPNEQKERFGPLTPEERDEAVGKYGRSHHKEKGQEQDDDDQKGQKEQDEVKGHHKKAKKDHKGHGKKSKKEHKEKQGGDEKPKEEQGENQRGDKKSKKKHKEKQGDDEKTKEEHKEKEQGHEEQGDEVKGDNKAEEPAGEQKGHDRKRSHRTHFNYN